MKKMVTLVFLGLAINGFTIATARADGWGENPVASLGGAILGGMVGGMMAGRGAYVVPAPVVVAPPVAVVPQPMYGYPAAPAYGYPAPAYPAYPAYQQPAYPAPYPYPGREGDDD